MTHTITQVVLIGVFHDLFRYLGQDLRQTLLITITISKEYKETPHKHPICNRLRMYNYHFIITFLYFKETFKIPLKTL